MIPAGWKPPGKGRQLKPRTPGYSMSIAEAAVALGVMTAKLAEWRVAGVGPDWCRDGEHTNSPVLYSRPAIERFAEQMREARAREPKAAVKRRIEAATKPIRKRK